MDSAFTLDWFAVTRTVTAYAMFVATGVATAASIILVFDIAACRKERTMSSVEQRGPVQPMHDPSYFTIVKDGAIWLRVPCEVCSTDEPTRLELGTKYGMADDVLQNTREPIRLHMELLLRAQYPESDIQVY